MLFLIDSVFAGRIWPARRSLETPGLKYSKSRKTWSVGDNLKMYLVKSVYLVNARIVATNKACVIVQNQANVCICVKFLCVVSVQSTAFQFHLPFSLSRFLKCL